MTTKTLTLRDTAKTCRYCGKPIEWKNISSNVTPIETATGIDHRERCNGMAPAIRVRVRDKNHEAAVKGFFSSFGAPL
jgi:hypothetical protein